MGIKFLASFKSLTLNVTSPPLTIYNGCFSLLAVSSTPFTSVEARNIRVTSLSNRISSQLKKEPIKSIHCLFIFLNF